MKHIGIVIADRGSAIVTVDRDADERLLVTDIERLPFDLDIVANRAVELDDPETSFLIDAEGLGSALWAALGALAEEHRWQLYSGRGIERQALVDPLAVAVYQGRFHFKAGLDEQEAMSKALVGYRRQVRDDGLIGSELVVALLLAIMPAPIERHAMFAWGSVALGPPMSDTPDEVHVGGFRLVRGPDGTLHGFTEPSAGKDRA